MSDLKMIVYNPTYQLSTIAHWANEEEYRAAERVLLEIGASRTPPADAVDKNADFYLANRLQIEAFSRYKHQVRFSRPKVGPPRLDMDFYVGEAGGHGTLVWANEDEYQQARKFMAEIGAVDFSVPDARYGSAEYFHLETREQYRALRAFEKSIEGKRQG